MIGSGGVILHPSHKLMGGFGFGGTYDAGFDEYFDPAVKALAFRRAIVGGRDRFLRGFLLRRLLFGPRVL